MISTSELRYQTAAAEGQSATNATVAGAEDEATSGTPQSLRTPPSTLSPPAGVADDAMDSNVSGVTTMAVGSVSAFLSAVMPLSALNACVSAPRATVCPAFVFTSARSAVSSACRESWVNLVSMSDRSSVVSERDLRVTGTNDAYVWACAETIENASVASLFVPVVKFVASGVEAETGLYGSWRANVTLSLVISPERTRSSTRGALAGTAAGDTDSLVRNGPTEVEEPDRISVLVSPASSEAKWTSLSAKVSAVLSDGRRLRLSCLNSALPTTRSPSLEQTGGLPNAPPGPVTPEAARN